MNIIRPTSIINHEDEYHPAITVGELTFINKEKTFDSEEAAQAYAEAASDSLIEAIQYELAGANYKETTVELIDG